MCACVWHLCRGGQRTTCRVKTAPETARPNVEGARLLACLGSAWAHQDSNSNLITTLMKCVIVFEEEIPVKE